jgi:hypothetical protein
MNTTHDESPGKVMSAPQQQPFHSSDGPPIPITSPKPTPPYTTSNSAIPVLHSGTKHTSSYSNGHANINHPNNPKPITIEELRKFFHLPIAEVAKHFGTCTTALKKLCRKLHIHKWPYRQILSLSKSIQSLEYAAKCDGVSNETRAQFRSQISILEQMIAEVVQDPSKAMEALSKELEASVANGGGGAEKNEDIQNLIIAATAALSKSVNNTNHHNNPANKNTTNNNMSTINSSSDDHHYFTQSVVQKAVVASSSSSGGMPLPSSHYQPSTQLHQSFQLSQNPSQHQQPQQLHHSQQPQQQQQQSQSWSSSSSGKKQQLPQQSHQPPQQQQHHQQHQQYKSGLKRSNDSFDDNDHHLPYTNNILTMNNSSNNNNNINSSNNINNISHSNHQLDERIHKKGKVHGDHQSSSNGHGQGSSPHFNGYDDRALTLTPSDLMKLKEIDVGLTTVQSIYNHAANKYHFTGQVLLASLHRKKFRPNTNRKIIPLMEPDIGNSFSVDFFPNIIMGPK